MPLTTKCISRHKVRNISLRAIVKSIFSNSVSLINFGSATLFISARYTIQFKM